MDSGGPIEPAKPVEPIAVGPSEEGGEIAPQALPVAAKELAAKEVAGDAAIAVPASVSVPPHTPVVIATEQETKKRAATIRLERKHPLAIRWMHWVNFPVLFTMIWSGLLIYWNDSDNAYQHPHAVYRVTEGLGYHFFFMWLFAINGILYVTYLLISGEWRLLVPERRSVRDAIQVTLVDLHLRKGLPPQKKYNGAQRIAYSAVILMGLGSLVTGLSIYKPTQVHWVTTLLGGYEMARWEHFWLTMGFCAFFVVHVVQVVLAGWINFRSMVSGYEIVPATKASLEEERSAR